MTTALKSPPKSTGLAALQDTMKRLDQLASETGFTFTTDSPFLQAITTASAIVELRAALTVEIMEKVFLPLMNSKLGFRTDKDPNRPVWNKRKQCMEAPEPYSVDVVRECIIEATLRGLPSVGNCWNIISGNAYVTKEGFWFLLGKRVPGVTDLKLHVDVPKMIRPPGDARDASDDEAKGAVVKCSASWKMNGTPDTTARDIPIRVNAMMGADAIMGKAERKILAAAHAQITGTVLGDADASEGEPEMRTVTPAATSQVPTGEGFTTADPVEPPAENPAAAAPARPASQPVSTDSEASPEAGSILAYYESVQVKRSQPGAVNPWVHYAVTYTLPKGPTRQTFTGDPEIGEAISNFEDGARIRLWLSKEDKQIDRVELAPEGGAA